MKSTEFFGHDLLIDDEPIDFSGLFEDESISYQPRSEPRKLHLSGPNEYSYVDNGYSPEQEYATTEQPFNRRTLLDFIPSINRVNKTLWKCGLSLGVTALFLFGAHLMVAERSGRLDDTRLYHLGNAGNAITVLGLLLPIGSYAVLSKLEKR